MHEQTNHLVGDARQADTKRLQGIAAGTIQGLFSTSQEEKTMRCIKTLALVLGLIISMSTGYCAEIPDHPFQDIPSAEMVLFTPHPAKKEIFAIRHPKLHKTWRFTRRTCQRLL